MTTLEPGSFTDGLVKSKRTAVNGRPQIYCQDEKIHPL